MLRSPAAASAAEQIARPGCCVLPAAGGSECLAREQADKVVQEEAQQSADAAVELAPEAASSFGH